MSVFWKVFGFLREKEIEYQKEEYKRTGSFTCSGAMASEEWISARTAEIENRIAQEREIEEGMNGPYG